VSRSGTGTYHAGGERKRELGVEGWVMVCDVEDKEGWIEYNSTDMVEVYSRNKQDTVQALLCYFKT